MESFDSGNFSTTGGNFYYTPGKVTPWQPYTDDVSDWKWVVNPFINNTTTTTGSWPESPKERTSFQVEDIEIIDEGEVSSKALAAAKINKQPDLLYIRFKLVHEGANNNLDFFPKEELEASAKTPIHKGLNWDHDEPVIGTIYSSEFVDPSEKSSSKGAKNKKAYILAEAVVWKLRYPKLAKKLIARHKQGVLSFSMEAYFSKCQCSVCGEVFDSAIHSEGSYCEHLNNRFNVLASESQVNRVLKGFLFSGAGVVEDPADVDALSEEVLAKKTIDKEGFTLDEKTYTQEDLDMAVAKAVKEAVEKHIKDTKDNDVSASLEKAQDELGKKTEALASATKAVETLTKERDEAKAELTELKEETEREKIKSDRLHALAEFDYALPEEDDEAEKALENIIAMSDDVFDFYLATVKSGVNRETPEPKEKEEEEEPEEGEVVKASRILKSGRIPSSGSTHTNRKKISKAKEIGDLFARIN